MKENFGVVPAIVTSLDDPKKQGRIKLKFPKLSSSLESAWAPVAAPLAGKQRGAFFMPEERRRSAGRLRGWQFRFPVHHRFSLERRGHAAGDRLCKIA